LFCPECEAPLRQDNESLHCPECQRRWPIINGIPYFVENIPYCGEIPLERMREVNRLAEAGPWKVPLLDSPDLSVRMHLDLDRANWQWLLNLPIDSRVLEVGAGMGTTSHALAVHYREVIALEPVLEHIRFLQQRFAQERLSNIKIIRSSIWVLPFAPESFDLVAMNGVLDRVAEGWTGDPGDLQECALKKILGLLRPGGYLYLGIENRLGIAYLTGRPDRNCGLPFITVLPRRLAHWYARSKGYTGYRNYLHSSRGYRKLLNNVGFTHLELYLAVPSYSQPRFLIPLDSNIFYYYSRSFNSAQPSLFRKWAHRILLNLRLLQYFEHSFVILARK
jgi:SAM-dependent methyltransferase